MKNVRQALMFLIFAALGLSLSVNLSPITQGEKVLNLEAWEYVLAAVLPFIIQFINRPSFTPAVKRLIMIGVTVGIALVTTYLQGELLPINLETLGARLVTLVGAVQVAYTLLMQVKPTRAVMNKLEVVTSPVSTATAVQQKQAVSQEQVIEYSKDLTA